MQQGRQRGGGGSEWVCSVSDVLAEVLFAGFPDIREGENLKSCR